MYATLRNAIVDGTFAPGERLRDAELERWLSVSRTPIREALLRLERAGLVLTQPGRSTIVAPVSRRATMGAQHVTAAMHELATRLAVPHLTEADLAAMEEANSRFASAIGREHVDAAVAADDDFHSVAVRVSENEMIRDVLEQTTPLLRRVERMRFSSLAGRGSVAQHAQIIARSRLGDADGAALAARENWLTLGRLLMATPVPNAPSHRTRTDDPHGPQ